MCLKTAVGFEVPSKSCRDIVEMTEENIISTRLKQRKYFLNVIRSVQYLARQGLPLQGNGEDGNFKQLLMLLCESGSKTEPFICNNITLTLLSLGYFRSV